MPEKGAKIQSDRGRPLGLVVLTLAATLVYAVQWEPVDQQPAGGTGYDVSIASGQGGTAVYTCVAPAGIDNVPRIYISTDNGSSWDSVFASSGMRAIEAFPTKPDIVYAGGIGMGVFKSTDGGDNWAACTSGMGAADITTIAVAPSDTDVVYAAGGRYDVGPKEPVYRTLDGGENWENVTPDSASELVVDEIAVDPTDADYALLGCSSDGQAIPKGIFATTDGGANWTHAYSVHDVNAVAISLSNPTVAYAGTADEVLKSTNGGQSWSATQWEPPSSVYSIVIHPGDEDTVYALLASDGVWRSTDGGDNWSQMATGMLLMNVVHSRICMDNEEPGTLFAGENTAGFYRTTNGGASWQQVSTWSPCRDIRKVVTDDYGGYYWTYDGGIVADVTADGGSSVWTSTSALGASDHADMVHPAADTMLIAGSYVFGAAEATNSFQICRSTDRGLSWDTEYYTYTPSNQAFYQFGVAPSDPTRIYGATLLDGDPRILLSTDCGDTWVEPENTEYGYPYNAVAVSPDDPDVVYFGCRNGQVVKTSDGGQTVVPWGALPSPVEIRRLVIDPNDDRAMYAATSNGVYRSEDYGVNWAQTNDGISPNTDMQDFVVDPVGSVLWAASAGPMSGPHVYVSYDGARSWTEANNGLPIQAVVYSLSFDSDRYLHAGTSVGVFTYDERSVPIGPDATYPNWGRKLVRDGSTLHVVYTGTNVVYYKQSTNGGQTWSNPEPVGVGRYPAIALNGLIGGAGFYPWVVYLTPGGSIMRAIRSAPGTWDPAVVFQSSPENSAGAPSVYPDVVAAPYATAYVTYPVYVGDSPTSSYIYYNSFTQVGVSQPEIVDGPQEEYCYGASVVANPAGAIHVCWIRGERVIYRERHYLLGWSLPSPISSPSPDPYVTEPASNPSMEAWGDHVYCVWAGPNLQGGFPGDIWQRDRWLSSWWGNSSPQSLSSELESDFPVMGTNYATFWHEEVTAENYDPWVRLLPSVPQYLFQTDWMSRYPHVDCYWPSMQTFKCNAVWTEQLSVTPPLYEVRFGTRQWPPSLAEGNSYEPATYYAAELGQPEPSPYCLSRGGYTKFRSWNTDTSGTILTYQLPYLDPRRTYKLRAVIYHEGPKTWSFDVRCDSGAWLRVKVGPRVPDTVWVQVPKRLYKNDARIILELARVTGDYASLAEIKLFQVEDGTSGNEGVQSSPATGVLETRLLACSPNPLGKATTISYQLAHAGPVALTVHDASGRLVRRLDAGSRPAGMHVVRWNGTDGHGLVVPAGVYFVRFNADGETSSHRVTLVR